MIRLHLQGLTLALVLAVAGTATAGVLAPYDQDFSGGAGDFTTGYTGGSSVATWNAANGVYSATINRVSGASFYAYSSVNVTNLPLASPANSQFSVSTLLENMSIGDTSVNVTDGVRFLADTTNSNSNAYVVDVNIGANPGRVRLVRWTGGTAKVYPDSVQANQPLIANFSRSDPYELQVFGSYNSTGLLDIAVEVTDVNHPTDLVDYGLPLTDITHTGVNGEYGASPPTGHEFGYYFSTSTGPNTTISSTYDNFAVTPEPSSFALLGTAVFGLCCWANVRRRRA